MTMDVNGSKLQTAYVSCIAKTFLHLHCKSWHMKSVCRNVWNSKPGPEQYVLRCCQIRLRVCHFWIAHIVLSLFSTTKSVKKMPRFWRICQSFQGECQQYHMGTCPKYFFMGSQWLVMPSHLNVLLLHFRGRAVKWIQPADWGTRIYTRTTLFLFSSWFGKSRIDIIHIYGILWIMWFLQNENKLPMNERMSEWISPSNV
jgi:hypothetical protein